MERQLSKLMTLLLMTLAVLVAAGCSEDDTVSGTGDDEITAEDVDVITEDFATTLADDEEGLLVDYTDLQLPSGSSKTAYTVSDTGGQNRGNLTITRVRIFYDSLGNASDRYDPETTVAMDRMLTIEGTRTNVLQTRTSSIYHSDSLRIDDIAPEDTVRTLNGIGVREVTSEFESLDSSVVRSFNGSYNVRVVDLMIERDEPYPLDGEIQVDAYRERTVTVDGAQRTVTVELSFTIEFDGTQLATMTLDDGTVYYIDLSLARRYRVRP